MLVRFHRIGPAEILDPTITGIGAESQPITEVAVANRTAESKLQSLRRNIIDFHSSPHVERIRWLAGVEVDRSGNGIFTTGGTLRSAGYFNTLDIKHAAVNAEGLVGINPIDINGNGGVRE